MSLPSHMWLSTGEANRTEKNHETFNMHLSSHSRAHAAMLCCTNFRWLMIRGSLFKCKVYWDVSRKKAFLNSDECATALASHTGLSRGAFGAQWGSLEPGPGFPWPHHGVVRSLLIQQIRMEICISVLVFKHRKKELPAPLVIHWGC